MRRFARQHTTRSSFSKGLVVPAIGRIGVLLSLFIAICMLTATAAEAGFAAGPEDWELEILLGKDLDGDGFIGPPPQRDPPPIGSPVMI